MRYTWNRSGKRESQLLIGAIIWATVVLSIGCAERKDPATQDLSPALQAASLSLQEAEAALKRAGVDISFDDLASLDDLQNVLPAPDELATAENQANLEVATTQFYEALAKANVALEPLEFVLVHPSPASTPEEGLLSVSDQALVHLYLGYTYALEAVARLQAAGGDLYTIDYAPQSPSGQVYHFRFLQDISGKDPVAVLRMFNAQQRQAVLDAVALLTGGELNAQEQPSAIDRTIFQRSSLFHIGAASDFAGSISPELATALDDLDITVNEQLASDILRELESWGFTLEKLPKELAEAIQ